MYVQLMNIIQNFTKAPCYLFCCVYIIIFK